MTICKSQTAVAQYRARTYTEHGKTPSFSFALAKKFKLMLFKKKIKQDMVIQILIRITQGRQRTV
jgi:hypothetical protein